MGCLSVPVQLYSVVAETESRILSMTSVIMLTAKWEFMKIILIRQINIFIIVVLYVFKVFSRE